MRTILNQTFFSFSFQALELDCESPFFSIYGIPSISTSFPYHIDLSEIEKPNEQLIRFNEPLMSKRKSKNPSKLLAVSNTIDTPRKTYFPNMLIFRSDCQKECKWHVDLDQSECGGLDRPIYIVFSCLTMSERNSTVGSVHTTLRELSLKNSIFPILQKTKHGKTPVGVFVVSGKTAQFCNPIVPPKGFNIELVISGYPVTSPLWVAIRAQSYYSDKYAIALEATMHHGEIRLTHEFDLAKYGGFERYFSASL